MTQATPLLQCDNRHGAHATRYSFVPVPFVKAEQPHVYWTLGPVAQVLGPDRRCHIRWWHLDRHAESSQRDCFVALAGENFDAHDFSLPPRNRAPRHCCLKRVGRCGTGIPTFVVDDTLVLSGNSLPHGVAHGRACNCSGGLQRQDHTKTCCARHWKLAHSAATAGNLNNLIGVPLTLLACHRILSWR